ncbi:hypothetical protein B5F14_01685 [Faecalitalea cylindroides]|uniref:Uncharacterized protein n=1 Tax=Faecalitalea cylindroides TaxID=39483 RepID=A0A1Y4LYM6_9FIRM|nr:hypothetical protein [Faecalitalea cylindroides]OUP61693.1 hypothetical protein B5F14_01685 [Faecalitalea cylindroides]
MNNYLNLLIDDTKNIMNSVSIIMVEDYYKTGHYITDCMSWASDDLVDIYTKDLLDWACDNYDMIDESINELGQPDNFLDIIRQGQYYSNDKQMYEDLNEIVKLSALYMIDDNEQKDNLNEVDIDKIIDELDLETETFEELSDYITDSINELVGGLEDE